MEGADEGGSAEYSENTGIEHTKDTGDDCVFQEDEEVQDENDINIYEDLTGKEVPTHKAEILDIQNRDDIAEDKREEDKKDVNEDRTDDKEEINNSNVDTRFKSLFSQAAAQLAKSIRLRKFEEKFSKSLLIRSAAQESLGKGVGVF